MSTNEEQRRKDYEKEKRWRLAQSEGKSKRQFEIEERKRARQQVKAERQERQQKIKEERKKKQQEAAAVRKRARDEKIAARNRTKQEKVFQENERISELQDKWQNNKKFNRRGRQKGESREEFLLRKKWLARQKQIKAGKISDYEYQLLSAKNDEEIAKIKKEEEARKKQAFIDSQNSDASFNAYAKGDEAALKKAQEEKRKQQAFNESNSNTKVCRTKQGHQGRCINLKKNKNLPAGRSFSGRCPGDNTIKCFVPKSELDRVEEYNKKTGKNRKKRIEELESRLKAFEQNQQFDKFMSDLDKKDPAPTHRGYIASHSRFSHEDPQKSTINNGKYNKGKKEINPSIGWITVQHVPSGRLATFPAFIKGFSDNFNLNWNEESVYGRMDSLYTYSSTKRSIGLSFVVIAERHHEAVKNMQNLDQLVQNLYPAYELGPGRSSTRLAAAPLLKISWGNLINGGGGRGMLVACSSVGIEHNVEAGFFEHGGTENRKQHIIPKEINVSMQCNVLHDFELGFKTNGKALERGRNKSNSFYNFPYGFETANISGEDLISPPESRSSEEARKELEKERDKLIQEVNYVKALRNAINFVP